MLQLASSDSVADYLRASITDWSAEEFWVFALNSKCNLIAGRMLFKGSVDQCFTHPRDIFRFALIHNASSIVVGHNHPSGDHDPSAHDIKVTHQLMRIGKLLQIPVLDHVIVVKEEPQYFSYLKFSHGKSKLGY